MSHKEGKILAVIQVPHPPIMIKEIAGKEYAKVEQTAHAMYEIAHRTESLQADSWIIITPHGPVFRDAVAIYGMDKLYGDLSRFGATGAGVNFDYDHELAEKIINAALQKGVKTAELNAEQLSNHGFFPELDHGVVAPLSFFKNKPPAVIMGMSFLSNAELTVFGIALREAIKNSGKKVVIIVSGDLSHRITKDAPAGYHPDGAVFDRMVVDILANAEFDKLADIPETLRENAGECGYRALLMGLGALAGYKVKSEILSYQAPFGVGYLVAVFTPLEGKEEHAHLESAPVSLARMTVENYVQGKKLPVANSDEIDLPGRAGVFVSIKKNGQLRGCIGTILPTTESVAEEIIRNAISAATGDPRFFPVTKEELPHLTYSVDVLSEPEPVSNIAELDPKKYGVIVRKGKRTGLLLPALEGVNTVDEQLDIALKKAGIDPKDNYEIYKFTVRRFT